MNGDVWSCLGNRCGRRMPGLRLVLRSGVRQLVGVDVDDGSAVLGMLVQDVVLQLVQVREPQFAIRAVVDVVCGGHDVHSSPRVALGDRGDRPFGQWPSDPAERAQTKG